MDTATVNFVLAVAGGVIVTLGTLLWWFVKDRVRQRDRKEELLEKRLSSGADMMQRLAKSVEGIQTKQIEAYAHLLPVTTFREYCQEHAIEHDKLSDAMNKVRDEQTEIGKSIISLERVCQTKFATLTDLVGRLVHIGTPEEE